MPSKDISTAKETFRTIASRIKQERERRAWTQTEVAEQIGSTRINISRWENGTTIPSPYYRQRLSELFEKNVQELGFLPVNNEETSSNRSAIHTPPLWNIQHRRNPFFTGRKEILHHLHTVFSNHHTSYVTLALSGLGGVGKTQIAIEYAYDYRDSYHAIFWLNASTRDTLSTDLTALVPSLALVQQEQEEVMVQAVKHWLSTHTDWLLILDNVDSLEMIADFLPLQSAGNVLLTTRIQILGTLAQGIEVENMTLDEGITFLLRRAKLFESSTLLEQHTQENHLHAATIVSELGGLPLALDQAGAYIEETQCGCSQYLKRYDTYQKELLLRRGNFPLNHPDPVATTWQLSFRQIEEKWPASTELLYLCAFLDPDSIPEELLITGAPKLGPILSKVIGDPLKLDSALEPLYLYSLIRRSPETHSLTMHRLVQAVLRQNLPMTIQKQWMKRVIRALHHAFPEVNITNWTRCQQFLPQVQICIQFFDEYSLFLPEAGHLFRRAGNYAYNRALYSRAEAFFQRALTIYEHVFSPEHLYTASGLHQLGELYRVWGRYEEAEPLFLRTLTIYKQSLPTDHLDIAHILNDLGELYHNLGRYEEAEPLFLRALSITEHIGGPDHHATFTTRHHLARLYHFQHRYKEAEYIYHQILNAQEQLLGINQVETAVILNNLAILYRTQGHHEQAKKLLLQSLQIEEELLGPDDPHTAIALQNLGVVYQKQHQYEEAEAIFQRALAIKEAAFGSEHLSTVNTMTNLASLYRMQKRYPEAKALFQKALASHLDHEHPYTAVILQNLARLHHEERNYEEAEALYLRALTINENVFPAGCSNMKTVLQSLTELYRTLGRDTEAISIEQRKAAL